MDKIGFINREKQEGEGTVLIEASKALNWKLTGLPGAINQLKRLVKELNDRGIKSKPAYSLWAKSSEGQALLDKIFEYDKLPIDAKRPRVGSLVSPHFHPALPLIGLNYTKLAHNTLFAIQGGWTLPLRLCRGITFDLETQDLVAFPFPKFFNFGDSSENGSLPAEFSFATLKYDGHLGIIFFYKGQIMVKTRGDFCHNSSKIGQVIIDGLASKYPHWHELARNNSGLWTILVEIIHPETQVIVDYHGLEKLIYIGAYWVNDLINEVYDLSAAAENDRLPSELLGLERPTYWTGDRLTSALLTEIKRREIRNCEGWVAFYPDGRRIKFKYETHIGRMVEAKLTLKYLMQRAVAGKLETMVQTLDEEIMPEALRMLGRISLIMFAKGDAKSKWRRLYELLPEGEQTENYKSACRGFAKAFTRDSVILTGAGQKRRERSYDPADEGGEKQEE